MKEAILLFFKGIAVGVANIIPGVSGGTMAVVLGIYERLVGAIGGFLTKPKERKSHIIFLALVLGGAIAGAAGFVNLITWALDTHKALTLLFFMGLIIGSLPPIIRMSGIRKVGMPHLLAMILGIAAVLTLGGGSDDTYTDAVEAAPRAAEIAEVEAGGTDVNLVLMFICGLVAGGAMIVPGISGSLVLLLLGQYYLAASAAKGLVRLDFSTLPIVISLGTGVVLGIAVFAKLIDIALKRAPSVTYSLIIGLVGGSVLVLYPGFTPTLSGTLAGVVALAAGAALSFASARNGKH